MTFCTEDMHQKSEVMVTHVLLLMKNETSCKFALQLYRCKLALPSSYH